jgi:hypothetical protein
MSPGKIREMMGPNFGLIRFGTMNAEEFSTVVGLCFICTDLVVIVFILISSPNPTVDGKGNR